MTKRILVLDLECYPNYFLVKFKARDNKTVRSFELCDGQALDRAAILGILKQFTIITFNGLSYDMPLLMYALRDGTDNEMLKKASDHIIVGDLRGWQFEQHYGVKVPAHIDHIDLKEAIPGPMIGLKQYGGRIHSRKLQDLPYEPSRALTREEMNFVSAYCENDLDTTLDLYDKARDPKDDIIATREMLTKQYGIDVRSKSDAQIAEAIIRKLVEDAKGERIYRTEVTPGTVFKYKAPAFLQFRTPLLRQVLAEVTASNFVIGGDGKVKMPQTLEGRKLTIGSSTYSMGIGGLHSTEKSTGWVQTALTLLRDIDVASYYPSLIIQCGLSPENMGELFQRFYRGFRDQRLHAKKNGNKSLAQTLKIFLNGIFGKLGSRWSVVYAPHLLIQVTVTGQLALLMLIERFEMAGIPVISANTDGVVQACPVHLDAKRREIVAEWERDTGLETEETKYRALFSRDVNNYIALKEGGGYKTKGTMADPGFMKNPQNMIVNDAVALQLDKGVPVAETILRCRDIRRFLTVKRVPAAARASVASTSARSCVGIAEPTAATPFATRQAARRKATRSAAATAPCRSWNCPTRSPQTSTTASTSRKPRTSYVRSEHSSENLHRRLDPDRHRRRSLRPAPIRLRVLLCLRRVRGDGRRRRRRKAPTQPTTRPPNHLKEPHEKTVVLETRVHHRARTRDKLAHDRAGYVRRADACHRGPDRSDRRPPPGARDPVHRHLRAAVGVVLRAPECARQGPPRLGGGHACSLTCPSTARRWAPRPAPPSSPSVHASSTRPRVRSTKASTARSTWPTASATA
jgi:hypothetical protein